MRSGQCHVCGEKLELPLNILYSEEWIAYSVCDVCADDLIEAYTGCRFGDLSSCTGVGLHEDCGGIPLDKLRL